MNPRYLTAAVAIPAALVLVFIASPSVFLIAAMIFAFVAYSEFVTMNGVRHPIVFLPAAALLMFSVYAYTATPHFFILHVIGAFLLIPILTLLGNDDVMLKHRRLQVHLSGFLYLLIPLSLFPALRDYPAPVEGKMWFLFALVIPWVCDSAAYFAGRAFGKHLFAPQISPKKTWEGAAAGLVASTVAGGIFSYAAFEGNYLVFCLVTAALASTAGQLGDLIESLFKRGAGAKDSGVLFPGHGGILDRLDSVFYSVTVVYLALKYMEYHVG
ncbi:MAG TPA: phosphatidate cytidylyltransferase [bacterium]|nr:phosphatidate cytidylyltransferase [bacterium]